MQASGHRFDPDRLHHFAGDETRQQSCRARIQERPAQRSAPIRRGFAATDGLARNAPSAQPRDEEKRFAVREHGD